MSNKSEQEGKSKGVSARDRQRQEEGVCVDECVVCGANLSSLLLHKQEQELFGAPNVSLTRPHSHIRH